MWIKTQEKQLKLGLPQKFAGVMYFQKQFYFFFYANCVLSYKNSFKCACHTQVLGIFWF